MNPQMILLSSFFRVTKAQIQAHKDYDDSLKKRNVLMLINTSLSVILTILVVRTLRRFSSSFNQSIDDDIISFDEYYLITSILSSWK